MLLENEGRYPSRWAATMSISSKTGCLGQTLNKWVEKAEVGSGRRIGIATGMAERMKALERENRELRQATEILRKASACFAMAERHRKPADDPEREEPAQWLADDRRPRPSRSAPPSSGTPRRPLRDSRTGPHARATRPGRGRSAARGAPPAQPRRPPRSRRGGGRSFGTAGTVQLRLRSAVPSGSPAPSRITRTRLRPSDDSRRCRDRSRC